MTSSQHSKIHFEHSEQISTASPFPYNFSTTLPCNLKNVVIWCVNVYKVQGKHGEDVIKLVTTCTMFNHQNKPFQSAKAPGYKDTATRETQQ